MNKNKQSIYFFDAASFTKLTDGRIAGSKPACNVRFEIKARRYGKAIAGALTLGKDDIIKSVVISSSVVNSYRISTFKLYASLLKSTLIPTTNIRKLPSGKVCPTDNWQLLFAFFLFST